MKKIIITLLIGTIICISYWHLSDGFSIANISDSLPFDSRWEVDHLSSFNIGHILSQPFNYLEKTADMYVFESSDKQYILKFFKFSQFRLPSFQETLPLPPFLNAIQNKCVKAKKERRDRLFSSCKLAYKEFKDESGLVYVHLNKSTNLSHYVTLFDSLKRTHIIPIDQYAFVLQKRGEKIYSYLGRLIREKKVEEAKRAIISLSLILDKELQKGINDESEIHKSAAFLQGKAMFLDIGQLKRGYDQEDRQKSVHKLILWLETKDPKLAEQARIILS